jgi:hypothetical protein
MKLSRRTLIRIVAGAVGLLTLTGPAAFASANGFTLNLATSSTPVVGMPTILHATGTIPLQDLGFPYWFSLDAIPTTVTTTCPPDRWEGAQFAASTGSIVVLSQSEIPDAAGDFSIPVAVTPSAAGSVLLCGYTDDGEATTLAATSLTLNIQPNQPTTTGSPQAQPPTTTGSPQTQPPTTSRSPAAGIPTQLRHGIRSCLALLAPKDARGCIHGAVKRADRSCGRLHAQSRRTACLRAVRTIAKRYR